MVNLSTKNNESEEQSIVAKILSVLWQRIFIVIIAVAIALIAFFGYFKLKKPDFTAYEKVNITVKNTATDDKNSTVHIDSERKYASTVAKFISTGKVVDRANFYYNEFKAMMEQQGYGLGDYMRGVQLTKYIYTVNGEKLSEKMLNDYEYDKKNEINKNIFNVYSPEQEEPIYENVSYLGYKKEEKTYKFQSNDETIELKKEDFYVKFSQSTLNPYVYNKDTPKTISRDDINVTYDMDSEVVCFIVSYKDFVQPAAGEKAKMVVLSANREIKEKDTDGKYKYFKTLKIELDDYGESQSTKMNVSRKKMLIIFIAVGLAIGIAAVYLSTLIERSVTSKKEIEEITGVPLLAHIESLKEREIR